MFKIGQDVTYIPNFQVQTIQDIAGSKALTCDEWRSFDLFSPLVVGKKIVCNQDCQRGVLVKGERYTFRSWVVINGIRRVRLSAFESDFPFWMFDAAPEPVYKATQVSSSYMIEEDGRIIATFEKEKHRNLMLVFLRDGK